MHELARLVRELIASHDAHAARTVVLVPYVQLIGAAHRAWATATPDGFAPRFETTQTWVPSRGFEAVGDALAMDMARDIVSARAWIDRAGLASRADLLAGRVVEAAWQLAPAAAAVAPSQRRAWADRMGHALAAGFDAPVLELEAHVARIAIQWSAASSYPSDALLEGPALHEIDLLVVVEGVLPDALARALLARAPEGSCVIGLRAVGDRGDVRLHEADDPSDEAHRSAACVIAHVNAGRVPVALAATDRVLTRRIHAMLASRRVGIRDESGWKLSTTRAAASPMLALRASAWDASSDDVLDWLKNSPRMKSWQVSLLERRVRRNGLRDWRFVQPADAGETGGAGALVEEANRLRDMLLAPRPLHDWLEALFAVLAQTGQWDALRRDAAGIVVIDALRLDETRRGEVLAWPHAARRLALAEFTSWCGDALESPSFRPEAAASEEVVILPLNQLLGRSFGALVMPGCDEVRLPASPDPAGIWTAAQREMLGLPSRESMGAAQRLGWQHALSMPMCDVVYRRTDESGETLLPSVFVQALVLEDAGARGSDPRVERRVVARPSSRPAPQAASMPVVRLSASSYEDLRRCPYRFFAMRQLQLQEQEEIDTEVDKRDFGNWLHQVLREFHERLREDPQPPAARAGMLDEAAGAVTKAQRFQPGEFLPFESAWPQVRDGYLAWLAGHEAAQGAVFAVAESEHEVQLGAVTLFGRIDRIDRLADGLRMVIDYKTEPHATSKQRVAQPGEDTQLAFYAALLEDDTLRAAYVNVGERGETKTYEQHAVVEARDLLVQGILDDVARVGAGAAMPAIGEGIACEYCSARGLCRKDSWS